MGPVLTWESLESTAYTMRAIVLVLLGAVAINAEAEADPVMVYTHGVGHVVHPVHHTVPVVNHVAHPFHHNYWFGKREAEAKPEAEADPYVMYNYGMVHHTGVHHP